MSSPTYTASIESLRQHRVPAWFEDAKFGIFIHWGLFSVPGFAAPTEHISDAFDGSHANSIVMTPYTEWYWNALRVPDSPTARFHAEHYGNRPYSDFKEAFIEGLRAWDPSEWARLFRKSGARYVVHVTKHHDGYSLWPSKIENPHQKDWCSERDIVGELAEAVRAEGLRFGVYYSGGIDWSWNSNPARTFAQFVGSAPGGDYPAYAEAQVRELIERYSPDVLWNDITWPTGLGRMLSLMADYYHAVPHGVINDRWMHHGPALRLLSHRPVQWLADALINRSNRRAAAKGEGKKGVVPPRPAHSDFRTPEYTIFDEITSYKWEATRGMSASFGYNRNHAEADYEPADELITNFIDAVSKNGNLLLNIGPRGEDAGIPAPQLARLEAMGEWLERNGEAIYGSRPWERAEAKTDEGLPVRFTRRADKVYAIVLGRPASRDVVIREFPMSTGTSARRLFDDQHIEVTAADGGVRLLNATSSGSGPALAFEFSSS
ncbi:MAG: alpha-L-fucosidase [bacterium]|nr:alpha-L-fucosidase [bacterium]